MDYKQKAFLQDCMEGMAQYPDKYFELAVVDPPYGIGASKQVKTTSKIKYRKNSFVQRSTLTSKNWDFEKPSLEFFTELFRVSQNQIIWGGNYFANILPETNAWIIWNKLQLLETRSDGEMAWTSFSHPLKIMPLKQDGFKRAVSVGYDSKITYNVPHSGKQTIHPTQKPVALYDWIFKNYAKQGDKILDTHLGSGSSRIAAHKHDLEFYGYEIDAEYFEAQEKRFNDYTKQLKLF